MLVPADDLHRGASTENDADPLARLTPRDRRPGVALSVHGEIHECAAPETEEEGQPSPEELEEEALARARRKLKRIFQRLLPRTSDPSSPSGKILTVAVLSMTASLIPSAIRTVISGTPRRSKANWLL